METGASLTVAAETGFMAGERGTSQNGRRNSRRKVAESRRSGLEQCAIPRPCPAAGRDNCRIPSRVGLARVLA